MIDMKITGRLRELKDDGATVVGCFPLYPPLELFHSLGIIPVVLWGLGEKAKSVALSDKHLQSYTCSVARLLTQFVLSDSSLLDGLFVYNACDTLRNLPEILDGGRGSDDSLSLFRMHIPAIPSERTGSSAYLKNELSLLKQSLEKAFAYSFSIEKFRESVNRYREMRNLSLQMEQLVAEGKASFAEYAEIARRGCFIPVEEHIAELIRAIELARNRSPLENSVRGIILSGILPPPLPVIKVIESVGLRIVGNDIASLHRSYAFTPEEVADPERYYVAIYEKHYPCSTILHSGDQRVEAIVRAVRKHEARGVIFIGEKFCEYEYFEFPYLEQRLRDEGCHSLLLEFSLDDYDPGAIRTRIEAFAEVID
jgi:benzoyl-CoA reductase/2-hydroxyglutaryl-CoA dehydratase subunit BcrC/BadD/HgdB